MTNQMKLLLAFFITIAISAIRLSAQSVPDSTLKKIEVFLANGITRTVQAAR